MPPQPQPPTTPELRQLRDRLRKLLAVKPVNGGYTWEGVQYTKKKYDQMVTSLQDQIAKLEKSLAPTAMETTAEQEKKKRELASEARRLRLDYNNVQARRKDIEAAIKNASTIPEQNNLRAWLPAFQENERRLKEALDAFDAGYRPANVPAAISLISIDQMRNSTPGPQPAAGGTNRVTSQPPSATATAGTTGGGAAPTPGVAYGGMPAGTTAATTTTEAAFPAATPTSTTAPSAPTTRTTTAGVAGTGGTPAAIGQPAPPAGQQPGGAWVTDPATGQQYYLPPNIDFAWLATQVPEDWKIAARKMLGPIFDAYMADPELAKFVERMMQPGVEYDDKRFMAELMQTQWWTSRNQTQRDWFLFSAKDSTEAEHQISKKMQELKALALDRGLTVEDGKLRDAALIVLRDGMETQSALNWLGEQTVASTAGSTQLLAGYYGQQARQYAADYGIPISDITLQKWVGDIATGNQSLNSFKAWAKETAKNMYPALASGFDRGLSFNQMTSSYAQWASNLLEIPSESIDFTDPKWAAAFTMRNDKGEQTQMSYGEWNDYLRTNPAFGYEYTSQANDKAYQVVNELARMFGAA